MNAQDLAALRSAAANYQLLASQTQDPVLHRELTRASILCAETARQGDRDTLAGSVISSVVGRLGGIY